jgi:hypothetical protein
MMPERLPFVDVEPIGVTRCSDVERARTYVASRRIMCRLCGEDDAHALRFAYGHVDAGGHFLARPQHRLWDVPIARLVQLGAGVSRLRWEMSKCVVVCRACHCRAAFWSAGPQMLRCIRAAMYGVVAKEPIARCGGRNPAAGDAREGRSNR